MVDTVNVTVTSLPETRTSVVGTSIAGSKIYEEYLGSLQTSAVNYAKYDKMRRSDSQIKRTLRAMVAPIMSGKFKYIAPDQNDAEMVKQATFKNKFFMEYPKYSWYTMLYEILSMLPFGFSIFEPTYYSVLDKELGQIITLKNLGFIKQSTIVGWDIQDNEVIKVHQQGISSTGQSKDTWLDGKNLVVFTFDREGDNFEGVSVLRAAYGNYIRKDLFYKIDMIGIEKMAIGTPVWYAPNSVLENAEDLKKLQAIAENYVGHEQAYLILSDKFKDKGFEIMEGKYDADSVNQAIKREDAAIVDAVLASFLNIGTARAGGNAQNEGQMGMFLESLVFIAKDIADLLDYLAHQAYVLNFGDPGVKLTMQVSNITKDDANKAMEVLRGYITAGAIRADDRLETYLRDNLSLPAADEASIREFKTTPDYKADQTTQDANNPTQQSNPENINVN